MYSSASLAADNEIEEQVFEARSTPFHKWPRKDKRIFVERFCSITVPTNQNGSSKNLQITCNCCGKVFRGQLITALVHLAGARKGGQRISICPTPNEELKAEVLHLFSLDHVHSEEALNEEALHIAGENFHHAGMVDMQLQQQQQFLQNANKLMTARDRATAKRKRDYAMKTLSIDPTNSIDQTLLRFLADADLKPKVLELDSFQELVRQLRAAPKSYQLPGINRPEDPMYTGPEGIFGGGVGSGGVNSNSGSGEGGVSSGSSMVQSMMMNNAHALLGGVPTHGLSVNPTQHSATDAVLSMQNTQAHLLTSHSNANTNNNTANPTNQTHHTLHTTTNHDAHKRNRHAYTSSATVDAGDSDSEQSVNTLPQM